MILGRGQQGAVIVILGVCRVWCARQSHRLDLSQSCPHPVACRSKMLSLLLGISRQTQPDKELLEADDRAIDHDGPEIRNSERKNVTLQ